MTMHSEGKREASDDRTLTLTRLIDAPPHLLFRAWTEPELLKQWFAPLPYTTPVAELDVRPGGRSLIVMRSPEGQDMPNPGVYLEVVKDRKIVATDAFTKAWEPSQRPFMTLVLTFEPEGQKTRYTAKRRGIPRTFTIGRGKTKTSTSRWDFTKAGGYAPIS